MDRSRSPHRLPRSGWSCRRQANSYELAVCSLRHMSSLVLFDLDNTLVDRAHVFREWAASFAARLTLDGDAVEWIIEQDGDGRVARQELFAEVRARFGISASVAELVGAYRADLVRRIRPDLGVLAALESLRRAGCRIGVVTNGDWSQRDKIDRAGLSAAIDGCCVSQELGASKPSPSIFQEVARRCEAPMSGWMVGDDPIADIQGGHRVGLRTIWIARGRSWTAGTARPDHVVENVPGAVERILEAEEHRSLLRHQHP